MLTDSQRRALSILAARGKPIGVTEFAQLMWPQSRAWQRYTNRARGAVMGGGIIRSGGAYLGRLIKAGWVSIAAADRPLTYRITPTGLAALVETKEGTP